MKHKLDSIKMDYYTLTLLLLLEAVPGSFSTPHLACYSCIYNPSLSEGSTIVMSPYWMPKLRHRSYKSTRQHQRTEVLNTQLCALHPGQKGNRMPVKICPKVDGYRAYCNREYATENDTLVYVSRGCYYSNGQKQIILSSETLDPRRNITKRRQQQLCSNSLCNEDHRLVARFVAKAIDTQEYKKFEDAILQRGKRTPTESPTNYYQLDNEPSDRRRNKTLTSDEEDVARFDEDAEADSDDENYYNADGSGAQVEFNRWYPPTDDPQNGASSAISVSMTTLSFLSILQFVIHMAY